MSEKTPQQPAEHGAGEQGAPAESASPGSAGTVRPQRYRRTVWTAVAVSQLVLAVITALVVSTGYGNLNANLGDGLKIAHADGVEKVGDEDSGPLNILVMGSDSRSGAGNAVDGQEGIGERSDTTILLHVSADRSSAYGVSLPRDAIVDRPDCRMNNGETVQGAEDVLFNTAFAVGGPQCTVQTVEKLTGVYIDHFLVLDFNGFKDMVNAVNGVEVCIPEDVRDPAHDIYLEAGTQTLDGQAALEYVRERTVLSPTGDIGRMKRQQAFIASMVKKVMSAGILSQPARVYDFLSAVTSSIKVDAELDSVAKLADLAMQFQDTGLAKIDFITVPIEPYPPDPNRLVWAEEAEQLWERIKLDRPLGRTFSDTSIEADDSVGTATGEPSPEGSESPTEPSSPDEEAQSERAEQRAQAQAEARRAAGLCV